MNRVGGIKMRKIYIVLLASVIMFMIAGCSNNKQMYEKLMKQGIEEIEKEEYTYAESFFQKALEQKPNDEAANSLLEQTKHIQVALEKFAEGDFDDAIQSLEKVTNIESATDLLVDKAKDMEAKIADIQSNEETYYAAFEQAKEQMATGKSNESLQTIEKLLEKDLSHPFYAELKQEAEALKAEAIAMDEKAKKEGEERAQAKAMKQEAERKEEVRKKAEKEKRGKETKSNAIGAVGGYWLTEDRTTACHITSNFIACAVKESDVFFNDKITKIKHVSETETVLTINNDHKTKLVLVEDDVLQTENERLYRVSKDEANAIYDGYYELP